jgi:toxic protein SymE
MPMCVSFGSTDAWMKLAGRWIEHAGFQAGQHVKISVEHGRLIITAG